MYDSIRIAFELCICCRVSPDLVSTVFLMSDEMTPDIIARLPGTYKRGYSHLRLSSQREVVVQAFNSVGLA